MSWSKLWQRGGRKEKKQAPASQAGPETVTLAWVAAEGAAHCEVASMQGQGKAQINVQLSESIEPDTPVWLISANGVDRSGTLVACNVQQGRLIGHITLRKPAGKRTDGTATRIQWIEPGGDTVTCAASLTGKGDGRIRVSLPRVLPASARGSYRRPAVSMPRSEWLVRAGRGGLGRGRRGDQSQHAVTPARSGLNAPTLTPMH